MATVFRIRASALPSWPDCPRRAAASVFRPLIENAGYRLRRRERTVAVSIGLATHLAAEVTLNEKARSGSLPPASVATDCALDELSEHIRQGVEYDETTANRADAVKQTLRMVASYYREVAPQIEPLQIEHRLEADVTENIILTGQPDVVALEPFQVDDLKTGIRQRNHNGQIGAYSLLARSAGIPIKQAAIDFVRRVGANRPQPPTVRTVAPLAIAEQTAFNTLRHIQADLDTFTKGNERFGVTAGDPAAFLANPTSLMCSARWCSAHGTAFCNEWRRQ